MPSMDRLRSASRRCNRYHTSKRAAGAKSSQTGDDPPGRDGEVVSLEIHRVFEAKVRIFVKDFSYPPVAVRGIPFEGDLLLLVGVVPGEIHLVGARDPAAGRVELGRQLGGIE